MNIVLTIKKRPVLAFTAIYALLLVTNSFWFFSDVPPLESEAPIRIVLGALLVFIMPGLVWGEVLGFESDHILMTIALSFALTLTIEVLLLPIPFVFGSTITLWVALILCSSAAGLLAMNVKLRNGQETKFINSLYNFAREPFPFNISRLLIVAVIVCISYGTYRWGENLTDIAGEKLLHMIFVRYYYSMPMILKDLGLAPGTPPVNLIHLWEYLLAGWATLINMDPLPLFYRARFVVPFLGFSGMYLLIRNIFKSPHKSEIIFWALLIMCLGWFVLLSPSSLDWIKDDPFRGVMSFMGTVHHADTAMDILIALNAGLILMTLREFKLRNLILLGGVLSASFMWHPREFFQSAIYAGVFGITIILARYMVRKSVFKRWFTVMAVFLVVAFFFFGAMSLMVPKQSHGYDEFALKKAALRHAFYPENIIGIRNLFNFPFHLTLSKSPDPAAIVAREELPHEFTKNWNHFSWLILSALCVPLLAFLGEREDRVLSMFYILLWFLLLAWNFSMLILFSLTYSELHITTPRGIYIFSYIVIGAALYLMFQWFSQKSSSLKGLFKFSAVMLGLALAFKLWWGYEIPHIRSIEKLLSVLVLISFIVLLIPRSTRVRSEKPYALVGTVIGMLLFFPLIIGQQYIETALRIMKGKRPPMQWFGKENPLGFSPELIGSFKSLPMKETILVYPLGKAVSAIYAPHYMAVVPDVITTVISARGVYDDVRSGRHPLFIDRAKLTDPLQHQEIPEPDLTMLLKKSPNEHSPKQQREVVASVSNQRVLGEERSAGFIDDYEEKSRRHTPRRAKKDGPLKRQASNAVNQASSDVFRKNGLLDLFDQKRIQEWLDRNRVDYILVDQEYYGLLRPYFGEFTEAYDIILDRPEDSEMLVHYFRKTHRL